MPIEIVCCDCYALAKAKSVTRLAGSQAQEWRSFVTVCVRELQDKQAALKHQFDFGSHERWDWDQERAELVFSNNGKPVLVAAIEFVGSVSSISATWLWSWANFNLLPNVHRRIDAVRDFGEEKEFPHLVVPKWAAEQADGWEMAAVAARVLQAEGVYRTPGETGHTFMLLMDVRRVQ